jgi:osmotically inducible protein OsmC
MKPLYTAVATAKGGRGGHAETSDGKIKVDLAVPKEMGGPGGAGTNPEQLFAAGYAACFGGALGVVARQHKVKLDETYVTAHVTIGTDDSGGFGLAVELSVRLPGIEHAQALQMVQDAHQVCPYSKATRGNIEVKLSVE